MKKEEEIRKKIYEEITNGAIRIIPPLLGFFMILFTIVFAYRAMDFSETSDWGRYTIMLMVLFLMSYNYWQVMKYN